MATSAFAQELVSRYAPEPAFEDKLFISDLAARLVDFDQSLPGSAKASFAQTTAYFA